MRIFLSGTSFLPSYGGPAYSVSSLAAAIARLGVHVGVWSPDGSAATSPLIQAGSHLTQLAGDPRQAIEAFRADVIHDNGLWLRHNHALAGIAHRGGIPRVVSTRGMLEPWALRHKGLKKRLAWRAYQKRDIELAAALHATTSAEQGNLRALLPGSNVHAIPNGVDLPPAGVSPPERGSVRTALFVGRIYPVKGLPMLVEAWRRVRPPSWRMVIAGPDEAGHRSEIERLVRDAGLDGEISFAGEVTGAGRAKLLDEADLFVLPTHSESFGMAIAEALAHSRPVLTTTGAPWPQLKEAGCGWRVAPTVDAFTSGLSTATSQSDETLREMGRRGRELVSRDFQWDAIAVKFRDLYESLRRR
jgi:glycosyltransferase involved in cell wall biosynthesis